MNKILPSAAISLALISVLSSCGGGGGEAIPTSAIAPAPAPAPASHFPYANTFGVGVGFGGTTSFPFQKNDKNPAWLLLKSLILKEDLNQDNEAQKISPFDIQKFKQTQDHISKSKYVTFWVVKNWQENWYSRQDIQELINRGYTPVFMYWYFGDNFNNIPNQSEQNEYYSDASRLSNFLSGIYGNKLVIMEPEFNKPWLESKDEQRQFAQIIKKGIEEIKMNNGDAYFSIAMADTGSRNVNDTRPACGYTNCSLGDNYEWTKPHYVYEELANDLDFISFQEMSAQFSRDPSNPDKPISFTEDTQGINFLATRVKNFTSFLHDKYKKPVFLPYVTVATATWDDQNTNNEIDSSEIDKDGWNAKQDAFYEQMRDQQEELKDSGMFGYAAMALFDDPSHDKNGYQWFLKNEYHLGLIATEASDTENYASGNLVFKGQVLKYLFGE